MKTQVTNVKFLFLWGKYCYKHLPMGVDNSADIFQQKMNALFQGFEYIRAYTYENLILIKKDWTDHVQKLELTLNKPKETGFKYNIENDFFGNTEQECLGLWVTRDDVKPKDKKPMENMMPSTS